MVHGLETIAKLNAEQQPASAVDEHIDRCFTYHAPKPGQPERYERLRYKAKELAYLIAAECPPSRERSIAMTELETAVFWANAAIARNE